MRYSAAMADDNNQPTADFDRLARRYLDLWQGQLAGLTADPSVTDQIARLFAVANAQVAAAMQSVQGAAHGTSSAPDSKVGSPSAAAASRHGADDVGELRKRVATLEARIAELEGFVRGAKLVVNPRDT